MTEENSTERLRALHEFDAALKRIRSKFDPSYYDTERDVVPEWSEALRKLIGEFQTLEPKYIASRWDTVFEMIEQFWDEEYLSFQLNSLPGLLKDLEPDDALSRLTRVEKRAEGFTDEHYYEKGGVFEGLVYGLRSLAEFRLIQLQRFDQYRVRALSKLIGKPQLLGRAIATLAQAITGLKEKSQRTRCYDDLAVLVKAHLSRNPRVYFSTMVDLSMALSTFPLDAAYQRLGELQELVDNLRDDPPLHHHALQWLNETYRKMLDRSMNNLGGPRGISSLFSKAV